MIRNLKASELFSGIPGPVLTQQILPLGSLRSYAKGQMLLQPGQRAEQLGLVICGRVRLLHITPGGDYSLLEVLCPGEMLFADLVCTRSRISPYHAISAGDTSILWFRKEALLHPGCLPEAVRQQLSERLLTLLAQESLKKEYRIAILSRNGLRERILAYLTLQQRRLGTNPFSVRLSREEMAAYLCVNRSALSHALGCMRREGLLDFHRNHFCLSPGLLEDSFREM